MFPGSPTPPSLSLPSSRQVLICDIPHFQAHQPAPPPPFPPVGKSFVTCHISKLTNTLLPFPPFQSVSPPSLIILICRLTSPVLSLPPSKSVLPHSRHPFVPTSPSPAALSHP